MTRTFDLNAILAGVNLLVMGLLLYALLHMDANNYVDQRSYLLGIVLCLQTQAALWLERRQRDPFVILLAFATIFFYSFRIFTLALYGRSDVFDRYPYAPEDSNYALVFMLIANCCIYLGLYLVKIKRDQVVDVSGWRAAASTRIVVLMAFAILYAYFSDAPATDESSTASRLLGVLNTFLAPNVIILMSLSYFFLFRRKLSRMFALTLATLIVFEMIVHTLLGSRSAILVIVQNCMFVGLAMAGRIRIRRRSLLLGIALLPLMMVLLVGSFVISTYNRTVRVVGAPFDLQKAIASARESGATMPLSEDLELILPPIFSRAAYFDFSAEIIAHREQYRSVINLPAYYRSIVDNILTPGFDVYDQPKISLAMQFVYAALGEPSKERSSDFYQSDQLGLYGEFYALFGYGCLPILFAGACLLKWGYARLRSTNPFILTMKRVVLLFIFERSIDSYGIDWTIEETIPLVIAIFVFTAFFSIRRDRATQLLSPPLAAAGSTLPDFPALAR
jgi:hypothetical protein